MKLKDIVSAYRLLGEAKVTTLDDLEVLKIIRSRRTMRPMVEDFNAFVKDVYEKFKPNNFEEMQEKWQRNSSLTVEEKQQVTEVLGSYNKKTEEHILPELEKDVKVEIEKLTDNSISKLLKENKWEIKKLESLIAII